MMNNFLGVTSCWALNRILMSLVVLLYLSFMCGPMAIAGSYDFAASKLGDKTAVSKSGVSKTQYQLGSGDKIKIQVYGESDLTVETVLGDAGTISYPFLGELAIKGLTVSDVEQLIIDGLKGPYLIDPKLTVTIVQYRPFYISGEVEKAGGYPYTPGLTLRKAISLAGGFTERASKTKFDIVRESNKGSNNSINIKVKLDSLIYPGDIITINQSFF